MPDVVSGSLTFVAGWWARDIIGAGKLPLLLTLVSFIVTFLVTRTITRLIRSGRGPFRNNVSNTGTHIHHSVPGVVLLVAGSFTSIGAQGNIGKCVAAVLVGLGVSLVLDEFALLLHLRDVYWTQEGQTSVAVVSLAAASLMFALIGYSPVGVARIDSTELTVRITGIASVAVNAALLVVCLRKGKFATTVLGIFIPFVALVGSLRLARPTSPWARKRYSRVRMAAAVRRQQQFDDHWGAWARAVADFVAGRPSQPRR